MQIKSNRNNYKNRQKQQKLDSTSDTRLAHNTLAKAKPKYSSQSKVHFYTTLFIIRQ